MGEQASPDERFMAFEAGLQQLRGLCTGEMRMSSVYICTGETAGYLISSFYDGGRFIGRRVIESFGGRRWITRDSLSEEEAAGWTPAGALRASGEYSAGSSSYGAPSQCG